MFKRLIKIMRIRRVCRANGYNCPECIYHEFLFDGVVFRGVRCRLEQERENQKPLTLDELQKMDGQPVWCVYPDCDTGGEWFICDKSENEVSKNKYGLPFRYYGEWTAYRYQPKKEAQHDN